MRKHSLKQFALMLGLLLPALWCGANSINLLDGFSHIVIMAENLQGIPKTNSIQATIDGHILSVVFLEDLGQVTIDVSFASGGEVEASAIHTPNGVNFYIPNTGSYVVTFTLPNGDEYYGEFEVSD